MKAKLKRFLSGHEGSVAIEYGLVAAAMGLLCIAVFPDLANQITMPFASIAIHLMSGK